MSLCSSRRVQSPPLQCTETLSTRKCFRCLWVFFVGNFGLKILGQGCITAQHFTLQYLGARTWGSSSILWVVWIVISNVCHGLRRGSLGTWGDWSCAGTSRGAATQPLLSLPLPTLPTNNLCLLCAQTITVMIIDAPSIGKPDIQFKQTTVEHLEKNF